MPGPMLDFGPDVTVEQDDELTKRIDAQNRENEAKRNKIKQDYEKRLFVSSRREQAKSYANELFRDGKYKEAAAAYERMLPMAEEAGDEDLKVAIRSNLCAVRLKEWRWKDALQEVDNVLALRPNHAKALYRQAQAYRGLNEMDLALQSIAASRAATAESNKAALSELDNLENNIRKQLERWAKEDKERKAAQERKDRRLRELAKKQKHKMDVRREGKGVPLPPAECGEEADPSEEAAAAAASGTALPSASAAEARRTGNWAGWWYDEISKQLTDEDNRMMLHDEDGWVEVTAVPETKAEIFAKVCTNHDGTRSLYYEVNMILNCMVAQFRAPQNDPGCLGFHIEIAVKLDHTKPVDEWHVAADYCKASDYQPATRIRRMMETYVRPNFVPYMREQIQSLVDVLVKKCTGKAAFKMITDARAEKKRQKAKEKAEKAEEQARMAERMQMALDAADKDMLEGNVPPVGVS